MQPRLLFLVAEGHLDPGRRIAHLSRHLDLAPVLLDLAGVRPPASFRGRAGFDPADEAIAEDGPWRAVYAGDHNLVLNRETGVTQLFSAADRVDATPLADAVAEAQLRTRLDAYVAREQSGPPAASDKPAPAWSEEERERLRALGYAD